jgi:pantoate--beta-alanine ligase
MSSRNQYLTAQERNIAPQLYQALSRAAQRLAEGETDLASIERAEVEALTRSGFRPEYFAIRDAQSLNSPTAQSRQLAVLVAARLGKARLIDNVQITR